MPTSNAVFELNSTTLAAIGAILGTLAGAISYLMRQLINQKDSQIADLKADRDYWREAARSAREQRQLSQGRDRTVRG